MDIKKESPKQVVTITYRVDEEGEFYVDALLSDYEAGTIDKLSTLIASIPTMKFQIQTISIIKNAFLEEGMEEELESLLASVLLKSEDFAKNIENTIKQENETKDSGEDEPCIKPSDML